MKNEVGYKGFTLIELLVVVLIIGILAAVALPQYQKAVLKSRMSQWDVIVNTQRKGIDMYLLEEGYPSGNSRIDFLGTAGDGTLDLQCKETQTNSCVMDRLSVTSYCTGSNGGTPLCEIYIHVDDNYFSGYANLPFMFEKESGRNIWYARAGKNAPREYCQWIGARGFPAVADTVSQCAAFGVALTPYE